MKKKLISGLAALVSLSAVFTACSSDLDVQNPVQQGSRTIRLTSQVQGTRSIGDPQGANLTVNTEVGVFGTDGTTALNSNEKYTVNASNGLDVVTTDNAMTWPTDDATSVTVYAYAPYQNGWTVDGSNNAFSVNEDQTSNANYLVSDLVWATASKTHSAATDDKIPLSFSHSLTKVNITISKAAGSNVNLAGATVYITNTVTSATVNAQTGVATASTGTNPITVATISSDLTAGDANSTTTACAVIIPQTLAANTAFIKIVTTETNGSKTLIAKLGAATTFAANTSYDLSISVGSVSEGTTTEVTLKLGSSAVSEWNSHVDLGNSFSIGDYILKDGTIKTNTEVQSMSDDEKKNISAVIFSKDVSDIDAAKGYVGYAVSVCGQKESQQWASTDELLRASAITSNSDAVKDWDGLTITKAAQAKGYASAFAFTNYEADNTNFPGKRISEASNLSGWFMPSYGQMILLFMNLGKTPTLNSTVGALTDQNETSMNPPSMVDILSRINSHKIGSTDIISAASNDKIFVTSTEYGTDKMWALKISTNQTWTIARQAGKSNNNRCVLPILAFKLP